MIEAVNISIQATYVIGRGHRSSPTSLNPAAALCLPLPLCCILNAAPQSESPARLTGARYPGVTFRARTRLDEIARPE